MPDKRAAMTEQQDTTYWRWWGKGRSDAQLSRKAYDYDEMKNERGRLIADAYLAGYRSEAVADV
jgi:hypothetical protein